MVIIVGLERGLFPHMRAIQERNEDEERHLFHVALTRARETLVFTYAEQRVRQGRSVRQRPSPILDEIPEALAHFGTPKDALMPATAEEMAIAVERLKVEMLKPSAAKWPAPT